MFGPTKDFIENDKLPNPENSSRFGNSGKVSNEIFKNDFFAPLRRDIDYRSINKNSTSYFVQKFIKKDKLYISGFSGMMNCGSLIFDQLEMDPLSEVGNSYCEALAAYIVGASMHSNPPKLRHFSNFSDSWPCAVFDLGYVVLSDFHDGGTSDRQSSRAFPAAVCQPFCRSLRPAEEWASTV